MYSFIISFFSLECLLQQCNTHPGWGRPDVRKQRKKISKFPFFSFLFSCFHFWFPSKARISSSLLLPSCCSVSSFYTYGQASRQHRAPPTKSNSCWETDLPTKGQKFELEREREGERFTTLYVWEIYFLPRSRPLLPSFLIYSISCSCLVLGSCSADLLSY